MLAAALLQAAPAAAATRTVTSAADSGAGSLRDAIAAAVDGDLVRIDGGVNPALTSGEIVVNRSIAIRGQNAGATTISAGGRSRIFRIAGGAATIEDVTLTAGRAPNGAPGASDGGSGGNGEDGGAILIEQGASLILRRTAVTGSRAGNGGAGGGGLLGLTGGNGGNGGRGGAVASFGTLTIEASTFGDNRAGNGAAPGSGILSDGAPGAGGSGGAVYVNGAPGRTTRLVNVTLTENVAGDSGPRGAAGGGGAVFADGGGGARSITINHATIVGNSAGSGSGAAGGGLASRAAAGVLTVFNSILASNTAVAGGPNCSGAGIRDGGHNVARPRGGCPASFANGDPKLDPKGLADNGGPTRTIAIVDRGSAMNQIERDENCAATDQRGFDRPQGARCDIGAFEIRAPECEEVAAQTRPGRTIRVRLRCSGGGPFRYLTASDPSHGKLSDLDRKDGTVKYTAGRVFRGQDTFTYKGTNFVGDSPSATVTITIGGPPPPPNNFRFGKVDLNRRKGTADLPVKVPGPGKLRISGKGVESASKRAEKKGTTALPVKPTEQARRRLKRQGVATVTAIVTFTPKGGFPQKRTKQVRLRINEFSVPL